MASTTLNRCDSLSAGGLCSSSSSSVSTKSSSVFDYMCDGLLVEILQRVPLKDVHRCKCVSKRWLISASSTAFARCHARYQQTRASPSFALFYQHGSNPGGYIRPGQMGVNIMAPSQDPIFNSPGFSLNFIPSSDQPIPIRILAASNGLVLCTSTSTLSFRSQYYVCNPLTKQWVALPPIPPNCKTTVRICFICTGPNPDSENFNFNLSSFRVVQIWDFDFSSFSSEAWEWTKICLTKIMGEQIRQLLYCPLSTKAVECNGILHWKSQGGKIFAYDPYNKTETNGGESSSRVISFPKDRNTHGSELCFYFGEFQGRLRYIQFEFELSTSSLWELQDYDNVEWCC